MRYIENPDIIAKKAREFVEQLDLGRISVTQRGIVQAMVQATADPSIAEQIRISPQVTVKALHSILTGELLCDVEMVKAGINREIFTGRISCYINDIRVRNQAAEKHQTRSMVAVDMWKPYLNNATIVIGNAPTALFRLIELMEQQQAKPALIIGIPVGFVGAAEAKRLL